MDAHKSPPLSMPAALQHYWTMWNETELDLVRGHLDKAVSTDFVFSDPRHLHTGRDALEINVKTLRSSKPRYRFVIASELDEQNGCFRYEWHMMSKHRVLLEGFDVAKLNAQGLLDRVDGFFGPLRPVAEVDSGIPAALQASSAFAKP